MIPHNTETPDVETSSDAYARRFSGPVGAYFLDIQAKEAIRLLQDGCKGAGRVLEVGGGHGQLTATLLERGFEVWIHGSDATCARRTKPLTRRYGDRLRFVTSNLWELPFQDKAFDFVVALRLLAHVKRWEALLLEMARVCRHDMLVDYPPVFSLNAVEPLLFPLKRKIEGNTRPYFCYRTRQLVGVLRQAGFSDFSVSKEFAIPMVVHRSLKRPQVSKALETAARVLGLTQAFGSPAMLLAGRPRNATAIHR